MKLKKKYFILLILLLLLAIGAVSYSTYSFVQSQLSKNDDTPADIIQDDGNSSLDDSADAEEKEDNKEDEDDEKDKAEDKEETKKPSSSTTKPSTNKPSSNTPTNNNSNNNNSNNNSSSDSSSNEGTQTPGAGNTPSTNTPTVTPSDKEEDDDDDDDDDYVKPSTPAKPTNSSFALYAGRNHEGVTLTQSGTTITISGDLELTKEQQKNIYIHLIITAPDAYPTSITDNSYFVDWLGRVDDIVLGVDTMGRPYTIYIVEVGNGADSDLTISWGNGKEVTYTLKYDLNITTPVEDTDQTID